VREQADTDQGEETMSEAKQEGKARRDPGLREPLRPTVAEPTGGIPVWPVPLTGPVMGTGSTGEQAAWLGNSPLQRAQRQALVSQIGRSQGNRHLQTVMASLAETSIGSRVGKVLPGNWIARLVPYNETETDARFTDPELASGVLPFTEDGWDGMQIGRRLTQLNPRAPRSDAERCVETSFLVALIQRGPGALRDMVQNYLRRYRAGLRQASTPERIKGWYRRSLRRMEPLLAKIDDQTLTYDDLSTILTEMYDVYGGGGGGTSTVAEISMLRREGYEATELNLGSVSQEQAAAQAQALLPGEYLACGVEVSVRGTGPVGHEVHIGRHPETGALYFYDPWPVRGDQLIECDEDLTEIEHYFVNPIEAEEEETEEETEEEGFEFEIQEMRTFSVDIKFTPPAEETEEE
jgi:hypothetical protein